MNKEPLPEWAGEAQGNVIWLDNDHAVTWTQRKDETEPSGGLLWHRKESDMISATPGWCVGGFTFGGKDIPESRLWTLEKREPLTLSPSILCGCGHHGFIREGKWVQA